MKFLVVLAALVAVAVGGTPITTVWTLEELSMALQNPDTNPAQIPYLEDALNQMMEALHSGQHVDTVALTLPSVTTYTLQDLSDALENPNTDPAHVPYLEAALNELMQAIHDGIDMEYITVVIPPPKPAPEVPAAVPGDLVTGASSPLVKIIVNVNQAQESQVPIGLPVFDDYAHDPMARTQ